MRDSSHKNPQPFVNQNLASTFTYICLNYTILVTDTRFTFYTSRFYHITQLK